MTAPDPNPVPVLHGGVLFAGTDFEVVSATSLNGGSLQISPVGTGNIHLLDPVPLEDLTVSLRSTEASETSGNKEIEVQVGGWTGAVDWANQGLVSGWLRNLRAPERDQIVVAFDDAGIWARAVARADDGGRFTMVMPASVTRSDRPLTLRLGAVGSDYLLDGGLLNFAQAPSRSNLFLNSRPKRPRAIRIKISCPNLKEAPMWGDYHFANSLAASFERIDQVATVDTMDSWYSTTAPEDVVLTIRGRHRVKIDPSKINIMWLISHPDRIPEDEFADYDHVAVASDIYAAELRERGVESVSVLHQATDSTLFNSANDLPRKPASLFVGNSRREYRTMVKWCVQKDIPLELYGGGWEGILPPNMVRGTSVANSDLPEVYGSHLMLLNDHWDSMRDNGFLSNRLFDGSAAGVPILTDPVAGLADVFGDTISEAGDLDTFAEILRDCIDNPEPYLDRAARARDIVLGAHTFDHRAVQLTELIEKVADLKI